MEPIKFISPSNFYYWEKCPLKAVYARNFRGPKFFPQHPDSDLGTLIHSFIENKFNWEMNTDEVFEKKWKDEVQKINFKYKNDVLQKVYFPIEWHSKYYAVRKRHLQKLIVKDISEPFKNHKNVEAEKWIDDELDIGGKIDFVKYNDKNEISEVVDFKTGKIFEIVDKKKIVKPIYYYQLALYGYLVLKNQTLNPNYYLQDGNGAKHKVEINQSQIEVIYNRAVNLKNKINEHIIKNDLTGLASPLQNICTFCDYRPLCSSYKTELINKFANKNVDVHGKVISVINGSKMTFRILAEGKVLTLKNIESIDQIKKDDEIYVYNLFCPDEEEKTLFATKSTIVIYE